MSFHSTLILWYSDNKRSLPWRSSNNPYFIWLSEVILQQTRVQQGLPYYNAFVQNFPTVQQLAAAPLEHVLKLWQGLGYYSRGRNLHKAAQYIVSEHNGVFPADYEALKKMPGVGDYTAAAIASFAFDLPHAVVDGNVYRVLARYWGIHTPIDSPQGKKDFQKLAQKLLPKIQANDYNQAIMEFGALHCTPAKPLCLSCPLALSCKAYKSDTVGLLPIKANKIKVRNRFFNYFFIYNRNSIVMQQRPQGDIWEALFEPILIETDSPSSLFDVMATLCHQLKVEETDFVLENSVLAVKHQLTHQRILTNLYFLKTFHTFELSKGAWIPLARVEELPVPILISKFINILKKGN